MENETNNTESPKFEHCSMMGILWWTNLVIAVLAVPSFGIVVSYIFPFRGIGAYVVFILACWLCTYLGMRLMANPAMKKTFGPRSKNP